MNLWICFMNLFHCEVPGELATLPTSTHTHTVRGSRFKRRLHFMPHPPIIEELPVIREERPFRSSYRWDLNLAHLWPILRCHNFMISQFVKFVTSRKIDILRCMCSKFCVKFQRAPLKFHTKFWTHTSKNINFTDLYFCMWFTISLNCDIIGLSETPPDYRSWSGSSY